MEAVVEAVHLSGTYSFSKSSVDSVRLVEGLGVDGDIHAGVTVKHRSRIARDPNQRNLRQVHLIHAELHEWLREQGFSVGPGQMGENVTTRGLDILGLSTGTVLRFPSGAAVRVTGLRNPCGQLNGLQDGLMKACIEQDGAGNVTERRAGIMSVVLVGGDVRPGDVITVEAPSSVRRPLDPV